METKLDIAVEALRNIARRKNPREIGTKIQIAMLALGDIDSMPDQNCGACENWLGKRENDFCMGDGIHGYITKEDFCSRWESKK